MFSLRQNETIICGQVNFVVCNTAQGYIVEYWAQSIRNVDLISKVCVS